jgi:hypothetical protein
MKLVSDPQKIGIGIWISIHFKAKHAIDDVTKKEFIEYMHMWSEEFPCGTCRGHIQEYLRDHPFEPYMNLKDDKGRDIGMFRWSWLFHNAVNLRLHKPFVSWQDAIAMFHNEGEPCSSCTVKPTQEPKKVEIQEEKFETIEKKELRNFNDKSKIVQGYFLKK